MCQFKTRVNLGSPSFASFVCTSLVLIQFSLFIQAGTIFGSTTLLASSAFSTTTMSSKDKDWTTEKGEKGFNITLNILNLNALSLFLLNLFQAAHQPVQRCKRVFQALITIALEELCETANALLAPVRFGVARPTAPFNLSSGDMIAVEELFSIEPLAPRSSGSSGSSSSAAQSRRSRSRSLTEGLRNSARSDSVGRLTSSGANANSAAVQAAVAQLVSFYSYLKII